MEHRILEHSLSPWKTVSLGHCLPGLPSPWNSGISLEQHLPGTASPWNTVSLEHLLLATPNRGTPTPSPKYCLPETLVSDTVNQEASCNRQALFLFVMPFGVIALALEKRNRLPMLRSQSTPPVRHVSFQCVAKIKEPPHFDR